MRDYVDAVSAPPRCVLGLSVAAAASTASAAAPSSAGVSGVVAAAIDDLVCLLEARDALGLRVGFRTIEALDRDSVRAKVRRWVDLADGRDARAAARRAGRRRRGFGAPEHEQHHQRQEKGPAETSSHAGRETTKHATEARGFSRRIPLMATRPLSSSTANVPGLRATVGDRSPHSKVM
jgi:hypothetical protein